MIQRTIKCDLCGESADEKEQNSGWQGWGAIHGISLNGVHNPNLCPACLARVAEFVDCMTGEK